MLPETLTLDQLSLVISQAAAPAFILGAVASFLAVLTSHMNRIVDRARVIDTIADDDPDKAHIKTLLPLLRARVRMVNRAIFWAVGSGISTCLLMIVAFGSAYFGIRHEQGAAILFTLSLGLFTASLIAYAREVRSALKHLDVD
jgi:hypothetical protein